MKIANSRGHHHDIPRREEVHENHLSLLCQYLNHTNVVERVGDAFRDTASHLNPMKSGRQLPTNYGELQGVITEEMPGPDGQQNPHTSYIDTFGYNIEAKVVLKAHLVAADIPSVTGSLQTT